MSIDNPNVEAVKRAVGHVNRREFEQLMSMFVPGGVRHDLAGTYPDLAGEGEVRDFLGQLLQGSPDFQIHLEDAFGSGDRVCTRIRVEGTHAGRLFGQEGTGRPFSVNQLNVYRFADGKMAESWQLTDLAGFMSQIGDRKRATPPPVTAEEVARRWVELYNDGSADSYGSGRFLDLYHEDVEWTEGPTRAWPEGRTGNLSAIRAALEGGQRAMRGRRVDLFEVIGNGDRAAMRYRWQAVAAVDGLPFPRGTTARLDVAAFLEVRDGKIARIVEHITALAPV
ncbi:MAG: ester cyclase [Dehalococcoidia bacterium]|nr:ester cyclase [Dehalococcoidia bacterium]